MLLLCTHPPAAILGYTNINICQAFTFGSRKIIYIVNYFSDGLDNTYLYSCRLNMRGRVFYYLWRLVDINILTLKYTRKCGVHVLNILTLKYTRIHVCVCTYVLSIHVCAKYARTKYVCTCVCVCVCVCAIFDQKIRFFAKNRENSEF